MSPNLKTFLVGVVLLAIGTSAKAQSVVIKDELSCASCTISLDYRYSISGPVFDGPASLITRFPNGEVALYDRSERRIGVYSETGELLRQIGRSGAGPGEYETPRNLIALPDSSLVVIDAALGRLSVFDGRGKFVNSTPFLARPGQDMPAVLLTDGQIVANATFFDKADAGYRLARYNIHGSRSKLFDEGELNARKKWLNRRLLWALDDGGLVVAKPWTFEFELYAADLSNRLSLVRRGASLPVSEPVDLPSDGVFDTPLTPYVDAMWVDREGLLWLKYTLPSERWRPGPSMPKKGGTFPDRETTEQLVTRPRARSVVEVIDLKGRKVLARKTFDETVGLSFGGGYLMESLEREDGEPLLRVSRLTLVR